MPKINAPLTLQIMILDPFQDGRCYDLRMVKLVIDAHDISEMFPR